MQEYIAILLVLLAFTVTIHKWFRLRIFKSGLHMCLLYAIVLPVGIIWDQYAISRGHWTFGEDFLLGPKIGFMPIEEYLFMIVVSYFGLVIFKLVEKKLK